MRLVLFLAALIPLSQAGAGNFWLRGPGACENDGDGTKYDCAVTPGGAGAWIVDRGANVNTGKFGDTEATVGAGDTLYGCGYYDLPWTGANARDFLEVSQSSFTWDANNPMTIDVSCPAGVVNGPVVADPVRADFAEDYLTRTWTNVAGNVWSTPLDGASFYVFYVACDDPNRLGKEVDSGNRAGYGADMPDTYCEFDGRGNSSTELYIYSEGPPSTYYSHLYASGKNFFNGKNPIGLRVIGDTTTDNYRLVQGAGYFQHMARAIYLGAFSNATGYTYQTVQGLYCEALGICVEHNGQAGATYYPHDMHIIRNGCRNLARACVSFSGKYGGNTEIAHNWSMNSNQSYSTGAFYWGGGMDRATHPNEGAKTMHHNFVDGVGWGNFWLYDGHGIYIEEGSAGVKAYSNWVRNLTGESSPTGPFQACFMSNSAYPDNSHSSSLCENASTMAKSSDSDADGDVSVQFHHLTGVGITKWALVVAGQAGDAPSFRNIHVSANGATRTLSEGSTTSASWSNINAFGFPENDYYNGSASPLSGRTKNDPLFIGGPNPTTAEGFRPGYGSPLVGAGTPVGVKYDFSGYRFNVPPTIGAHEVPGQSVFKPFR